MGNNSVTLEGIIGDEVQKVADHLQFAWDTVKDLQRQRLQRKFGKPKLHKLKSPSMQVGKGHRYLTVVLHLRIGAVVFVVGKGVDALEPYWKRLRRSRVRIEAVASRVSEQPTR